MQQIWIDKELGRIVLKKYVRSKSYTIRIRNGEISVSLPVRGSYKNAIELVEKHRTLLLSKIQLLKQKTGKDFTEADIKELRLKALSYLPLRLKQLAIAHGFSYNTVKISRSKSRWGSCSSKKNINLSLFLMLLPEYLIDYVLLHELCHTIEMNHGAEFWNLLDRTCQGRAKLLRKELKTRVIFNS